MFVMGILLTKLKRSQTNFFFFYLGGGGCPHFYQIYENYNGKCITMKIIVISGRKGKTNFSGGGGGGGGGAGQITT